MPTIRLTLIELLAGSWAGRSYIARPQPQRREPRLCRLVGASERPDPEGLIWPDHDDPDGPAATIGRAG